MRTYVLDRRAERSRPLPPRDRAPSPMDGRGRRPRTAEPPARGRAAARPALRRARVAEVREGGHAVARAVLRAYSARQGPIAPRRSRSSSSDEGGRRWVSWSLTTAGGSQTRCGRRWSRCCPNARRTRSAVSRDCSEGGKSGDVSQGQAPGDAPRRARAAQVAGLVSQRLQSRPRLA